MIQTQAMNVTAITRFKQGDLWAILRKLGWTNKKLAEKCGLNQTTIGKVINLQSRPTQKVADAIQRALGEAGEYFDVLAVWPETFKGLGRGFRIEKTQEVPLDRLIDHPEILELPAPEPDQTEEVDLALEDAIKRLGDDRRHALLKMYYLEGMSSSDIGAKFGITQSRVHSLIAQSIRAIRNKMTTHLWPIPLAEFGTVPGFEKRDTIVLPKAIQRKKEEMEAESQREKKAREAKRNRPRRIQLVE